MAVAARCFSNVCGRSSWYWWIIGFLASSSLAGRCWVASHRSLGNLAVPKSTSGIGSLHKFGGANPRLDIETPRLHHSGWHVVCVVSLLAAARKRCKTTVRAARCAGESAAQRDGAGIHGRRSLLSVGVATCIGAPQVVGAEAPDAGGARLSALTPSTLVSAKGKVFLITGATAGVGLEAARNLVRNGGEVYVCGRTFEKASRAVDEICGSKALLGKAVPLELDLASLSSVREFAKKWKADVQRPIDVMALNAGLALKQGLKIEEAPLSKDGYELTVATNHLGHFLLYNLLADQLASDARVVVTASSVHNPATGDPGAQATLGDLSGFGKPGAVMPDGGAYDSGKAYKDSKLCNVLFTLELSRRLKQKGSNITVNCFSPGLIPSKTFFRNQSSGFADVFAFAARNVLNIAETTEFGGDTLTFMALDPSLDGKSGLFYSAIPPGKHAFVQDTPSIEAQDAVEASKLWDLSAQVVGV